MYTEKFKKLTNSENASQSQRRLSDVSNEPADLKKSLPEPRPAGA
jgi:hypothetical protein